MGGPAPVELSSDCTLRGLEGGVAELYDALVAAHRFGLPASARCRLCGIAYEAVFTPAAAPPSVHVPASRCPGCLDELGARTLDDRRCAKCGATATLSIVSPAAALRSQAWATREQWPSRAALAQASSCDPDFSSLFLRMQNGERLYVIADAFANMGVRTTGREPAVQWRCETATVDGMTDESARSVIRAYAAAWNVPDAGIEHWMWGYENMRTSTVRQPPRMTLRRLVFAARWSDAEQEAR